MKIGLDAKRIFNNGTGLGVYGRNLLQGLQDLNTAHDFTLFTPKKESKFFSTKDLNPNFKVIEKNSISSYYWRTIGITNQIKQENLDIYHGLSNELPVFINKTKTKSIVDIHDLCFLHFPSDYSKIDQKIFFAKVKRAALLSDKIIATSEATKRDILKNISVSENKIEVIYQCCDSVFYKKISAEKLSAVQNKHQLPNDFILCVGTIQGRKNQKAIIQAIAKLKQEEKPVLVIVGKGGTYLEELLKEAKNLKVEVLLKNELSFQDLPAIYQLAKLFVYPSIVEGFGIPVLEAMASKTPVITSKNTSMAEIIANEDALINPNNIEELSDKISSFLKKDLSKHVEQNHKRALAFSQKQFAQDVIKVYESL